MKSATNSAMRSGRHAVLALLVLPLLLISPTAWPDVPKGNESFFESIDIDVVNVEVYATDRHGRPVPGLTRGDFQLLEDGKPVEITNFYTNADLALEPAPGPGTPETPAVAAARAVAASAVPEDQRLNLAVFVDNLNLTPAARNRVLASLKRFFTTQLTASDRVVLAGYDGQVTIRKPLSNDPKALVAAIETMASSSPRGNHSSMMMRDLFEELGHIDASPSGAFRAVVSDRTLEALQYELPQLDMGINLYAAARFDETRRTLAALRDFVDSLAGLQGRKALLYVSGELSLRPGEVLYRARELKFGRPGPFQIRGEDPPAQEVDSAPLLRELVDHANANRVTLYGLGAPQDFGNIVLQVGGLAWAHDLESVQSDGLSAALHTLTDHTGGLTAVDLNDPGVFLSHIRNDFGSFYSLGFSPAQKRDGKLHRIEVRVRNRRDVKLRYREAYQDRSGEQRITAATMSALLLGVEENPLGIQLDFDRETSAADGAFVVSVMVKTPISKLVLLPQQHFHEGRLTIFVGTRDNAGRTSRIHKISVPVRIPNEQLKASLGKFAAFRVNLLVRPEKQTVAVGVRDDLGHIDSTVRAAFLPGKLGARSDG